MESAYRQDPLKGDFLSQIYSYFKIKIPDDDCSNELEACCVATAKIAMTCVQEGLPQNSLTKNRHWTLYAVTFELMDRLEHLIKTKFFFHNPSKNLVGDLLEIFKNNPPELEQAQAASHLVLADILDCGHPAGTISLQEKIKAMPPQHTVQVLLKLLSRFLDNRAPSTSPCWEQLQNLLTQLDPEIIAPLLRDLLAQASDSNERSYLFLTFLNLVLMEERSGQSANIVFQTSYQQPSYEDFDACIQRAMVKLEPLSPQKIRKTLLEAEIATLFADYDSLFDWQMKGPEMAKTALLQLSRYVEILLGLGVKRGISPFDRLINADAFHSQLEQCMVNLSCDEWSNKKKVLNGIFTAEGISEDRFFIWLEILKRAKDRETQELGANMEAVCKAESSPKERAESFNFIHAFYPFTDLSFIRKHSGHPLKAIQIEGKSQRIRRVPFCRSERVVASNSLIIGPTILNPLKECMGGELYRNLSLTVYEKSSGKMLWSEHLDRLIPRLQGRHAQASWNITPFGIYCQLDNELHFYDANDGSYINTLVLPESPLSGDINIDSDGFCHYISSSSGLFHAGTISAEWQWEALFSKNLPSKNYPLPIDPSIKLAKKDSPIQLMNCVHENNKLYFSFMIDGLLHLAVKPYSLIEAFLRSDSHDPMKSLTLDMDELQGYSVMPYSGGSGLLIPCENGSCFFVANAMAYYFDFIGIPAKFPRSRDQNFIDTVHNALYTYSLGYSQSESKQLMKIDKTGISFIGPIKVNNLTMIVDVDNEGNIYAT